MRLLGSFVGAFHRHILPGNHSVTNIIHGFESHPTSNQQSHLSPRGSIAVGRVYSNFINPHPLLNTVHHQLPRHSTILSRIIVGFDPPAQNHSPILYYLRRYNPLPRATILAPRQAYHSPFNYDPVSNHSDRYNISCAFRMNWLL